MQHKHPKIAIVGRPNVGKSSLFNRIAGKRKAIVEPASGTTRDRIEADIVWKGKTFRIIDTGGFDERKQCAVARLVLKQLQAGIEEADMLFFVTDASTGILPVDIELSERLRKTSKRIFVIANKVDSKAIAYKAAEFFELGLGQPYPVSAANGIGIEKLLDDAAGYINSPPPAADKKPVVNVAITGRPNVGKSSYVNSVLQEDRVIVHAVAGTTRDAVDTDFEYKGRNFCLVDTAGMRHNPAIKESADFYGIVRSREAIKRSDAVVVLIDGFDGLREDDVRIVELALEEGKALVLAVNKWDLTQGVQMADYTKLLTARMSALKDYPIIYISCKTRRNVMSLLDIIWSAFERSQTVFGPDRLKETLKKLNSLPEIAYKRMIFSSLFQTGAKPPVFVLSMKKGRPLTDNLKKYVEKFLRSCGDFEGVPIKVTYRP